MHMRYDKFSPAFGYIVYYFDKDASKRTSLVANGYLLSTICMDLFQIEFNRYLANFNEFMFLFTSTLTYF